LNFNQRFHLGQYLLITLNYFRECVSAFADTEESPDLRVKVWMRLSNIVTLQRSFVKHFDSFPNLQLAYETEKHKTDDSGAGFSGALIPGSFTSLLIKMISDNGIIFCDKGVKLVLVVIRSLRNPKLPRRRKGRGKVRRQRKDLVTTMMERKAKCKKKVTMTIMKLQML
jgi:hypothetical protein